MKFTRLGQTNLQVSRLCLGTMNFGVKTEEKEAFRIMDAALEAGINFFDTANNYGAFIGQHGIAETIMGKWFAQGNGRREKVVLSSKVYENMNNPLDGPNSQPGLSRYKIRKHIETSLQRLQTDHLDIYFMHHIDRHMNWDEVFDTFTYLIMQGKVNYMGTSNFPGWALADMAAMARDKHVFGTVCEEHRYNLLCRLPELELIPSARYHGIGLVTYSPLEHGLLKRCEEDLQNGCVDTPYAKFALLCRELGEKTTDVALAWVLHNPDVDAPIIGPSKFEQLESSLHALEIILPEDFLKKVDEIFPGPGEAPEGYSW